MSESAKRKRPKVRYVVDTDTMEGCQYVRPILTDRWGIVWAWGPALANPYTKGAARRIAAALNWHEANKRGEL